MKIRKGFVTNSSSSSFIINKKDLTKKQIEKIYNHMEDEQTIKNALCKNFDKWEIIEDEDFIKGRTILNNFDMETYLIKIGIDLDDVIWDDTGIDFPDPLK